MLNPSIAGGVLKYLLGKQSTNPLPLNSSGAWITLLTTVPTASSSGFSNITEVSYTGYARQRLDAAGLSGHDKMSYTTTTQSVAFDGGTAETRPVTKGYNQLEDIPFPYTGSLGSSVTAKGYAIYNAASGGTCLFAAALDSDLTFGANTFPTIPKAALIATM